MILDIICIAFALLFALIGFIRGFARQVFSIFSGIAAVIGAYFLLRPVYNLLYESFLGDVVKGIGDSLSGITFLDEFAATFGKNTGSLLAEYLILFVLYIALTIVVGILWKILKKIVHPICDLKGIKFFDKLLGIALGVAWGLLIPCSLVYLATLASGWSFMPEGVSTAINDLLATLSKDSFLCEEYLIGNLDKVELFFSKIWDLIRKGFVA